MKYTRVYPLVKPLSSPSFPRFLKVDMFSED